MTGTADPQIERHAAAPCPSFAALSYGERFLVWAVRGCVVGRSDMAAIEREFLDACGSRAGPRAYVAFRQMVVLLGIRGRRPFTLGPPGWWGVTPDERRMLQVIASAQAGDRLRVEMHLAWLLREHVGTNATGVIDILAAALAENGHHIPLRDAPDAMPVC